MSFSWNASLLEQTEFPWNYVFLPRLESLTDDAYRWEPVAGCWSVRPDASGCWVQDGIVAHPHPDPPPFTSIAWRIAHITHVFGQRASNHFGDGSWNARKVPWTGSAVDAIALMTAEYERWREGVRSLGEDGLFRPCGPAEGPYADHPFLALVLHINREFLHHAAEVMLLMDLYRDTVERGELTLHGAG